MMEKEWASLTTEEYILVKHCGFTRRDVMDMFGEERKKFIGLLREEREAEERAAKKSHTPGQQQLPSRGG